MLYQIIIFLIEVAVTLLGGACLLRLYMRWRRMPMANPVGRFVQALSDWLVALLTVHRFHFYRTGILRGNHPGQ